MERPSRPRFDRLAPASPSYATLPIAAAFDWKSVTAPRQRGQWYLVCFRSIRRPDADEALVTQLDEAAHAEAASAPGFVHYFKGPVNERGECLSFCIWESRAAAREASRGPAHVVAAAIAHETYASYELELYRLLKRAGRVGFEFVPYGLAAAVEVGTAAEAGRETALLASEPPIAWTLPAPAAS